MARVIGWRLIVDGRLEYRTRLPLPWSTKVEQVISRPGDARHYLVTRVVKTRGFIPTLHLTTMADA
jgi:hypothetical protein